MAKIVYCGPLDAEAIARQIRAIAVHNELKISVEIVGTLAFVEGSSAHTSDLVVLLLYEKCWAIPHDNDEIIGLLKPVVSDGTKS